MAVYKSILYIPTNHNLLVCTFSTVRGGCEWYRSYRELRHLLTPTALAVSTGTVLNSKNKLVPGPEENDSGHFFTDRAQSRVLILGCGNSSFGIDMLQDGWTGGIVCVDFSAAVIEQMQQRYGAAYAGQLDYVCADITQALEFLTDASFDLIVCKGSLDAVLCRSRPDAVSLVAECVRLLVPGHGALFVVTSGNPDSRLEYLEHGNELFHYWRGVSIHPLKEDKQKSQTGANNGGATNQYVLLCSCYSCSI